MTTTDADDSSPSEAKSSVRLPIAIVGIGASAGGLEAIEAFFEATPVDSDLAFIVVQHLSPDYKSLMVELLSRKTELPVLRAENGATVEANHVYLIPPKHNLSIVQGRLLLVEQPPRDRLNLPIDIFLRSLAEDQGERAVAVILSGTGSDGTRGVRAIKEWGGLVMVQDEASAKFDGMPRAAASTGVADFVLPPSQMPAQLLACLRHPYEADPARRLPRASEETALSRIFALLRARTSLDFSLYKPSTVSRRIERRIAVTQVADIDAYVLHLENSPAELSTLYRELLIGVTCFFRDAEVMNALQQSVLPMLLESSAERELRFWVAGCSTGEEAYSLAILVREVLESMRLKRDVKVFATDVSRESIAKAGTGLYPEGIAADVQPALLAKYFYRRGELFQVSRAIREMVVFAQHNLLRDPPFTRIDFLSCRNVLIYLQPALQQRALQRFAFSLRPGGVLLLGTSETVGELDSSFEPVDRRLRVFRARSVVRGRPPLDTDPDSARAPGLLSASSPYGPRREPRSHALLVDRLLDTVVDSQKLTAVVVNARLEVLHSLGDVSSVLSLPSGPAVLDISKMVDRELGVPLAVGIHRVLHDGEEISYQSASMRAQDSEIQTRIRIRRLSARGGDEALAVVFFEHLEELRLHDEALSDCDIGELSRERLQELEHDLQFTRESLQATIEELESSNEELQATNEELLASNEELQSTNEELQSSNEELYTVNTEYQNKIIELTETQNDVDNLLSSSRIGTIILDEDLCIRRFSPQAAQLFNLVEADLGRPLRQLAHRLLTADPVQQALLVQQSARPYEEELQCDDGRWFLVRILPYHVGRRNYAGVVLTLIDVTPLREAREKLEQSALTMTEIVDHMPVGLLVYELSDDDELSLHSANRAALQQTGLELAQCLGLRFEALWPGEAGLDLKSRFLDAYRRNVPLTLGEVWYGDDRLQGYYQVQAFRLSEQRLAVLFDDISAHKAREQHLSSSESNYRCLYQLLADAERVARMGSWTWEPSSDRVSWSDHLFAIFGRPPESGAPSFAEHDVLYAAESMQRLRNAVSLALGQGTPYELELTGLRCDGSSFRCLARRRCEVNSDGAVTRVFGSLQVMDSEL